MKRFLTTLALCSAMFAGSAVLPLCAADAAANTSAEDVLPLNQRMAKTVPEWISRGVMYQINLRAYTPEGTLKAAEAKLKELADLGVTIVYLCPVFVADDDMDREFWSPRQKKSGMDDPRNPYRMKDFYHVDPEYGTDADLRSYVDTAHKLGLRVMLDMVYFHCGPTAVLIDRDPNFVKRDKDGKIIAGPWKFPLLNFESPELREYLFKNMEQWVRDYGVDGFRMDVADRIPLDFWETARERLEKLDPDIAFLAEGIHKENQLKAFDLCYGWRFSSPARNVIVRGASARSIRDYKEKFRKARPIGGDRVIHFIDNHDISNEDHENRTEKRYGEKGVNAALAMMFTLDGTPMLYCGQEVCDKNRHSIFGSKFGCMVDWANADSDEAKRRKAILRQLIETRNSRPELTFGELIWLDNSAETDVVTYLRKLDDRQTLILVNCRAKPVSVDVRMPDGSKRHFDLKDHEFVIE